MVYFQENIPAKIMTWEGEAEGKNFAANLIALRCYGMHFIEMYLDVFPAAECEEIIRRFEEDPRRIQSRSQRRVNPDVRTGTMLLTGNLPEWNDVTTRVEAVFREQLALYVAKYESLKLMARPERSFLTTPLIERINPGQGYDYHIDAGPGDTYTRILSSILYLRNVDEGGFTEFPYQSLRMVPRAGAMVIFPPFWTHLHRGATPISNTKYNITNFLVLRTDPLPRQ